MAATPDTPHVNDVGTFVSNTAIGFVLATPAETATILAKMKSGSVKDMTRGFINDLLVIKLLAPTESASLLIQPVPLIQNFVASLRQALVMTYHMQREERE